jgi:SAM-dependent methyltransferase
VPNFKTSTIVELARDVHLSVRVEAALIGVGAAVRRFMRSRSGKPLHLQEEAPPFSQIPTSAPSSQPLAAEQTGSLPRPQAQLAASEPPELKQARQQLVIKDQELNSKVEELEQVRQQLKIKSRELAELHNQIREGLPIPPPREIFLVAGTEDASGFLQSGEMSSQSIREILEQNGLSIEGFDSILEFGCGVGRILRHWSTLEGTEVYGTDYNPELIAWCKENLPFAEFRVNDLVGGLAYEDEKFDFIYAWSVFTHLTEAQQFFWIEELSRVLRPGGYLFITTHGEPYLREFEKLYRQQLLLTRGESYLQQLVSKHGESFLQSPLSQEEQERFRNGQMVVIREEVAGTNECNTFHPEEYVRTKLAKDLEVIDFVPGGAEGSTQDVYLLRKP